MLPPLPSFLPARPADALALEPAEPPASLIPTIDLDLSAPSAPPGTAGPSVSSSLCGMCAQSAAKYTCPRCDLRTCSASCSKAHKVQTGCNGQRDPTKFVTLNRFTQGDWGGDYAYLEAGRRQVADWGKDLPSQPGQGRHHNNNNNNNSNNARRGKGGGGAGNTPKVEGLRRELERRGVEVEFMPEGMGRRKLNQSSWNPKTQSLHITVQLSIHPADEAGTGGEAGAGESKMVNHLRVPYDSAQHTLASLLPTSSAADHVLALPFHPSSNHPTPIDILLRKPRPRLFFPPLTLDVMLQDAFRGMSWVEFPTLHVYSRANWEASVARGEVAIVQPLLPTRGEKRKEDHGYQAPPEAEAEEVKRARISTESASAPAGHESQEAVEDAAEHEVEGENDNEDEDEAEMESAQELEEEITEHDIQVMQALGAAAAADMA